MMTIDLDELRRKFPSYTIRSQPAEGCKCDGGVRKASDGHEFPCLCVCMSAPEHGETEYRVALGRAVGKAARAALGTQGQ